MRLCRKDIAGHPPEVLLTVALGSSSWCIWQYPSVVPRSSPTYIARRFHALSVYPERTEDTGLQCDVLVAMLSFVRLFDTILLRAWTDVKAVARCSGRRTWAPHSDHVDVRLRDKETRAYL